MIVAIAGAGTMGHALALVHALGGCEVRLQDISEQALDLAKRRIRQAFALLRENGAIPAAQDDGWLDRSIRFTTDLSSAVASAGLFIESVAENAAIKRSVFAEADQFAPAHAIFTSNTSQLDPFPLMPQRRLAQACAVHWYAPPYVIDLVDIAPSSATDPAVPQTLRNLYRAMGKAPVVFSRFIPGYVANRVQAAIARELYDILQTGAVTIEDIDQSLRHGLSLRMALLGHFMRSDFTGLRLLAALAELRSTADDGASFEAETLRGLVADGHVGIEASRGFYDYAPRSGDALSYERDAKLLQLKAAFSAIAPIAAMPAPPFDVTSA